MAQIPRKLAALLRVSLCGIPLLCSGCAVVQHQTYKTIEVPRPLPPDSYLVLGFTSAADAWDNGERPVRSFALRLRAMNLPGVYVETFENSKEKLALRLVRESLDRNHDGKLDDAERASAHIILYGHSLGGAAAIKVAKSLKEMGIPVLLTAQIDSVGTGDRVIPSNVARAINFYQHDSRVLRGRAEIRAEDPAKTTILGNFTDDYAHKDVGRSGYPWPLRVLGGSHLKVAADPAVWAKIESLMMQEIKGQAGVAADSGRP